MVLQLNSLSAIPQRPGRRRRDDDLRPEVSRRRARRTGPAGRQAGRPIALNLLEVLIGPLEVNSGAQALNHRGSQVHVSEKCLGLIDFRQTILYHNHSKYGLFRGPGPVVWGGGCLYRFTADALGEPEWGSGLSTRSGRFLRSSVRPRRYCTGGRNAHRRRLHDLRRLGRYLVGR